MSKCIFLTKGSLSLLKSQPEVCVHVSMFYVGYSTGPALFTYGANPCLAVVIHNKKTDSGLLAHFHMISADESWQKLRDYAFDRVFSAILNMPGLQNDYNNLQIFLFGATDLAYYPNENFPRYLAKMMPTVELYDKLDYPPLFRSENSIYERIGAQVLYWPAEHIVADLNNTEREYMQKKNKDSLWGVTLKMY